MTDDTHSDSWVFSDDVSHASTDLATFAARFKHWLERKHAHARLGCCEPIRPGKLTGNYFTENRAKKHMSCNLLHSTRCGRKIEEIKSSELQQILSSPEFSHAIDDSVSLQPSPLSLLPPCEREKKMLVGGFDTDTCKKQEKKDGGLMRG